MHFNNLSYFPWNLHVWPVHAVSPSLYIVYSHSVVKTKFSLALFELVLFFMNSLLPEKIEQGDDDDWLWLIEWCYLTPSNIHQGNKGQGEMGSDKIRPPPTSYEVLIRITKKNSAGYRVSEHCLQSYIDTLILHMDFGSRTETLMLFSPPYHHYAVCKLM